MGLRSFVDTKPQCLLTKVILEQSQSQAWGLGPEQNATTVRLRSLFKLLHSYTWHRQNFLNQTLFCWSSMYYMWTSCKTPRGDTKSFVRIRTSRYFDLRHIHINNIRIRVSLMLKIIQSGSHTTRWATLLVSIITIAELESSYTRPSWNNHPHWIFS